MDRVHDVFGVEQSAIDPEVVDVVIPAGLPLDQRNLYSSASLEQSSSGSEAPDQTMAIRARTSRATNAAENAAGERSRPKSAGWRDVDRGGEYRHASCTGDRRRVVRSIRRRHTIHERSSQPGHRRRAGDAGRRQGGSMRMILENEKRIRLEMEGEGFEIASEGRPISPYHLLAGSLASCTALVVASWAEGAGIDAGPLTITVAWEMVEERPKHVARMEMELFWPTLPEERLRIAERAADLCPIHATLERGIEIERRILVTPEARRAA
jgi:uncharacterized OsmC-like protein